MRRFLDAEGVAFSFCSVFFMSSPPREIKICSYDNRTNAHVTVCLVLQCLSFLIVFLLFLIFRSFFDELEYFRKHRMGPIIKIRNEKTIFTN
jgi:hypothetical protein